jgi:hypothetical protein
MCVSIEQFMSFRKHFFSPQSDRAPADPLRLRAKPPGKNEPAFSRADLMAVLAMQAFITSNREFAKAKAGKCRAIETSALDTSMANVRRTTGQLVGNLDGGVFLAWLTRI